ncbi:MAG: hypothetical protein IT204_13880 [Fimbriimonadaceae bacterium]|nr:hypothetical protein [Fimbriimonadaceae bacterium]
MAGWLACGLLALVLLSPCLRHGTFGPLDMLWAMTPWAQYRDQQPAVRGVHNPQLDVIQQYFPWRLYASAALRQGRLPLWNPHENCGQPFLGNVLSAVFYPFCWLAVGLPIGLFFLLSAWCHLTLLGGGLWTFLRGHGVRAPAALGAAGLLLLNTFTIGWLAYPNLSQWTFAWGPLLLHAWSVAWRRQESWRLAPVALLLGLVTTGGHVQIAFYLGLSWALYAAAQVVASGRWRQVVLWVGVPALLGGLLAAAQLLPGLEMARLSGRTVTAYGDAVASRVPWSLLVLLVAPWFYGHNALDLTGGGSGGLFWGPYPNGIEAAMSAGCGCLWLAVCGALRSRRRETKILSGLVVVGLLLAVGSPLYRLLFELVPGFSSLRGLSRAFAMVNLALAALAGWGLDSLLEAPRTRTWRLPGLVLAGTVALLLLGLWAEAQRASADVLTAFTPGLTPYVLRQAALALLVAGAVAAGLRGRLAPGLVAAVAIGELLWLGWGLHRAVPAAAVFPTTPEIATLQRLPGPARMLGVPGGGRPPFLDWMPLNTPVAYGLSSPCGSESLTLEAYTRLQRQCWDPATFRPRLDHPLLPRLGVRYYLTSRDLTRERGWPRVGGQRLGIYEDPRALSLAFVTTAWRRAGEPATGPPLDPVRTVTLPAAAPAPPMTAPTTASCYPEAVTPQRWVARGTVAGPAMVVLSTARAPGWQAWAGLQRVTNWPADGVLQAVAVPGGDYLVRWTYQPSSYRLGLFVALAALAAVVGWVSAVPRKGPGHERAVAGSAH